MPYGFVLFLLFLIFLLIFQGRLLSSRVWTSARAFLGSNFISQNFWPASQRETQPEPQIIVRDPKEYFSLPEGTQTEALVIDQVFEESQKIPLAYQSKVVSVGLNGSYQLMAKDGLIRVIIGDGLEKEYLLFEAYSKLSPEEGVISNHCEETCNLSAIDIKYLRVEINNASITINNLAFPKREVSGASLLESTLKLSEEYKTNQEEIKIEKINRRIKEKGQIWVAGKTSVSGLSYEEKKGLFSTDELPNLQGFEYYRGGIFEIETNAPEMPVAVSEAFALAGTATPTPPGPPEFFDWRNVHGENWLTSVKNQGYCGNCSIFCATSAIELLTNLYFNQPLNLDLSEQFITSCGNYTCNFNRGIVASSRDTFNYFRANRVVDEGCFSYRAVDNDGCDWNSCELTPALCSDQCSNPSQKIKVEGNSERIFVTVIGPSRENELKKSLISRGAVVADLFRGTHCMHIVGYGLIKEGDAVYEGGGSPHTTPPIISPGNSLIGKTFWIFKNSWGEGWGESGFGKISSSLANNFFYYLEPRIVYPPIISEISDQQIACVDKDYDTYCNWGISGTKPATCSGLCRPEKDCDDSNPNLGPYDDNFNCLPAECHLDRWGGCAGSCTGENQGKVCVGGGIIPQCLCLAPTPIESFIPTPTPDLSLEPADCNSFVSLWRIDGIEPDYINGKVGFVIRGSFPHIEQCGRRTWSLVYFYKGNWGDWDFEEKSYYYEHENEIERISETEIILKPAFSFTDGDWSMWLLNCSGTRTVGNCTEVNPLPAEGISINNP